MVKARNNPDVIASFCNEAFASQNVNHSQALVTLGLLGTAKSSLGEECLARFVAQPFPEKGTVVDGEILEQTALATLQAKAIDGLAYMNTQSGNRIVLDAAANHPSRIVRAEAIAAYLFNHNYSEQAKDTLRAFVHADERVFLDRPVLQTGKSRESFNRNLGEYLTSHPEVLPPPAPKAAAQKSEPSLQGESKPDSETAPVAPPKF
jgi:hypothetical protein